MNDDSVHVEGITDSGINLMYICPKGTYPFVYMRATQRLSRCLCVHGSYYRGNGATLCHHARSVVRFLVEQCNRSVTP